MLEIRDGEIEKDGLPYCAKCGQPRFFKSEISGNYVRALCKCQAEEKRATEEAEKIAEIRLHATANSAMSKRYARATFATSIVNESNAEQFDKCEAYCENAEKMLFNNIGVYIYGNNGTGKTHLTACMCNELIGKGYSVLYTSALDLINETSKKFGATAEMLAKLTECDFLILDDIGKESLGKKDDSYIDRLLLEIVNARYNNDLPTIFSSNYKPKDLLVDLHIDKAICERILEMANVRIELNCPSFRQKPNAEKTELLKSLNIL